MLVCSTGKTMIETGLIASKPHKAEKTVYNNKLFALVNLSLFTINLLVLFGQVTAGRRDACSDDRLLFTISQRSTRCLSTWMDAYCALLCTRLRIQPHNLQAHRLRSLRLDGLALR